MFHVKPSSFPTHLGHREILVYEKVAKPRVKLPRRTGLAKKEPLGALSGPVVLLDARSAVTTFHVKPVPPIP